MVSTRQMSNYSSAPSELESNSLRPTVLTRQSSTSVADSSSILSVFSDSLLSPAAAVVPINNETLAFKSLELQNVATSNIMLVDLQQEQVSVSLLELPEELLSNILTYVGFKKIGQLRVVSKKMNDVCMHILNSTFSKMITKTHNRFQAIKANMPRRESARRNHPLACECDIIETCYMRLSLLQMTFGKHIERGHCCFFPGAILDEVHNILNYIRNTPCLERPFRLTDELFDLSTMAMEYFRDSIEPTLPGIGYFNKNFFELPTNSKRPLIIASNLSDANDSLPSSPPQSTQMVLRKGIRKIKQGMKIYNNQLAVLRTELRTSKRKSNQQGKQIGELQKLLAEQGKQTLEYANRLDENDKKNEEMSRKFSTLLQELNKCKTELQYWRSKSPATPACTACGQTVAAILPAEDYQALINQGIKPENIVLNDDDDAEANVNIMNEGNDGLDICSEADNTCNEFAFPDEATTAKLLAINTATNKLKRQNSNTSNQFSSNASGDKFKSMNLNNMASTSSNSSTLTLEHNDCAAHKSVIVSLQSQHCESSNANNDCQEDHSSSGIAETITSCDNNTAEDVNSISNLLSHESKKARKVQKTVRCINASGSGSSSSSKRK